MRSNKKNLFLLIFCLFLLPEFLFSQSEIVVSPLIIEEKAKPREVLEFEIKIKNFGKNLYHFYTLVRDLGNSGNLERASSLAKWIEIFRGRTEILPGEEKKLHLKVKIPPEAIAGSYFAEVIFAQGSTEVDAGEREKIYKMPRILLNIEVQEIIVEKIQVKKFKTEKGVYFMPKIKFELELENIGNKEIEPQAKILIYDKRGKEIGFLELERKKILPNTIQNYQVLGKIKGMGQFKAVLLGEYGKNNEKFFQDTIFFWVLNWKFSFLFLLLILILSLIFFLFLLKNLKRSLESSGVKKRILDIFKK